MAPGKLVVTPCTIHGLSQNGYPTAQTFVGCYVSPTEKQRTNSVHGPEPHFQDTLQCTVGQNDHTVSFDVINEDAARPGHIGSGQVNLASVFESGKFEDWVPLTTSTGAPLGFIFVKLNFTPSQPKEEPETQYRMPPPPPPTYQGLAEDKKIQVNDSEPNPTDNQQPRFNSSGSFDHAAPPPAYNTPGGNPNPMSPSTAQGSVPSPSLAVCPPGPTPDGAVPAPFLAVCPPGPGSNLSSTSSPVTPPVVAQPPTEQPKKKGVPDWMKYGGAGLAAGAAAFGLGSWAKSAYDSHEEEEEAEEARRRAMQQQVFQPEEYQKYTQPSETYQPPPQEEYHQRAFVEEERHEEPLEEKEESEQEEQLEEEEEEVEEEDAEEEVEEEAEEEAEEEEEVYDRPVIDDSKWR